VDGTGSGSCPMTSFVIIDVGFRELII